MVDGRNGNLNTCETISASAPLSLDERSVSRQNP
jgi:hypothetical protein